MKWYLLFLLAFTAALERVNDYNFQKLVKDPGDYVLVDFYADWCRHCQKLMPTIEKLSEYYSDVEGIRIYKLNGGERSGRKSVLKYNIDGFPALVLFHGDDEPIEYMGGRDFESINNFLKLKTGIDKVSNPEIIPVYTNPANTKSLIVNDNNIVDVVLNADQPTLMFFSGEWCKYCKEFYPEFNQVKAVFSNDKIQFAEVVLDNEGGTTDRIKNQFGIKSIPAILLFDPSRVDSDDLRRPIRYEGKKKARDVIRFINREANLHRLDDASGLLDSDAGRLPELESKIKNVSTIEDLETIHSELKAIYTFESLYYSRILKKIMEGFDVKQELQRLNRLKKDFKMISKPKQDEIQKRINILGFYQSISLNF